MVHPTLGEVLDSIDKVKAYLKTEGIDFLPTTKACMLVAMARQRMKRHEREAAAQENNANGGERVVGARTANGLTHLKEKMVEMRTEVITNKIFTRAVFMIDDVSDTLTVRRHNESIDECRGRVIDGVCRACREHTAGVEQYSFEMELVDAKDENERLLVQAREGAGLSMFKQPAAAFKALEKKAQGDLVEKWCGVPVLAHFILSLNTDSMEVSIFPFKMRLLPVDFMYADGGDVDKDATDDDK